MLEKGRWHAKEQSGAGVYFSLRTIRLRVADSVEIVVTLGEVDSFQLRSGGCRQPQFYLHLEHVVASFWVGRQPPFRRTGFALICIDGSHRHSTAICQSPGAV